MEQFCQIDKRLEQIVALVARSEITSIRSVLSGIIDVINNPRSNARDLVELIQLDPPLTAKVLTLANSAFYARRKRVAELGHAVIAIGYDAVREIVLRQKVCALFSTAGAGNGFSQTELWKHSVAVAMSAKRLFRREFQQRGENAYVAGLLHDIGLIVEDQLLHQFFDQILGLAADPAQPFAQCEQTVLGCDHAQIGAAVAAAWSLPEEISTAIGDHHHPWRAGPVHQSIAATLFVADLACSQRAIGYGRHVVEDKTAYYRTLDGLGVHRKAVELIITEVQDEIGRMAEQGLL